MFLRTGKKFKDKTSLLTLNLFNGQATLNLIRDNKHGQIRKPRVRTRTTLRMSVIKLVLSPSEHSVFKKWIGVYILSIFCTFHRNTDS